MARSTKVNKIEDGAVVGIVPNGTEDCTVAIQAALNKAGQDLDKQQTLGLSGRSLVILPAGTYKISSTLTVPNGVTLKGETTAVPYPNRISGFKSNNNLFTGTEIVCSADFAGKHAIALAADNTNLENLILDGHSIPFNDGVNTFTKTFALGVILDEILTRDVNLPTAGAAYSEQLYSRYSTSGNTWSINAARSTISGNATIVTSISPFVGLTLNTSTGEVSGTATTLGTNTFYLRATSTVNPTIFYEGLYYIEVIQAGATPKIISRSLKTGTKGSSYSYQFNLEDITAAKPYNYVAINLPTGLVIDSSTGIISGTPTGSTFVNGVEIRWSDSVKDCARGATTNPENYSMHWIYTVYSTDISSTGGGYS